MRWYVYTLSDPRCNEVFYVGKGCGQRLVGHEKEARRGARSKKCDVIRSIQADGLSPVRSKIGLFMGEQDAYDFETDVITQVGLGNLTNVLPGGQRAWVERQQEAADRRSARDHEKTVWWLERWLANVCLPMIFDGRGVTFPGLVDGDKKAGEFVAHVLELVALHRGAKESCAALPAHATKRIEVTWQRV